MSDDLSVQSSDAEVKVVTPVENQVADADKPAEAVKEDIAAVVEKKPDENAEHERGNRIQKRIDRLTREKYEAIAEAKALKMMMDHQRPPQDQLSDKPARTQYATDEDFVDALTDWKLDQREKVSARTREQETHSQRAAEWNKRADVARQEYPDFDDVLEEAQDVPLHNAASRAILESDLSTDLQYYLAKHPDEAASTVRMSPEGAARFIGRIEAKVAAEKETRASQKAAVGKVSKAPAPITPVKPVGGGDAHINIHDPKVDVNTWMRERNKQLAGR